jgi:hypothetical protein
MRQKQTNKRPIMLAAESAAAKGGGPKKKKRGTDWRKHAATLENYVRQQPAEPKGPDVADLPPELLKQLSVGLSDPLGAQLIEVFGETGGCANLDQLLIGLYRKFHIVQNRRFLQNRIWRMVRKGQLRKAPDTRGMFCLAPARNKKRRGKEK